MDGDFVMGRMYSIDEKILLDKPEIRIGDKIFAVDNRLKTFEKINDELKASSGDELYIVLKNALGEKAFLEIEAMDLSFAVMYKIMVLIMAAMQDITEEEAERRFQRSFE